jgi:hypothetical protein
MLFIFGCFWTMLSVAKPCSVKRMENRWMLEGFAGNHFFYLGTRWILVVIPSPTGKAPGYRLDGSQSRSGRCWEENSLLTLQRNEHWSSSQWSVPIPTELSWHRSYSLSLGYCIHSWLLSSSNHLLEHLRITGYSNSVADSNSQKGFIAKWFSAE